MLASFDDLDFHCYLQALEFMHDFIAKSEKEIFVNEADTYP